MEPTQRGGWLLVCVGRTVAEPGWLRCLMLAVALWLCYRHWLCVPAPLRASCRLCVNCIHSHIYVQQPTRCSTSAAWQCLTRCCCVFEWPKGACAQKAAAQALHCLRVVVAAVSPVVCACVCVHYPLLRCVRVYVHCDPSFCRGDNS